MPRFPTQCDCYFLILFLKVRFKFLEFSFQTKHPIHHGLSETLQQIINWLSNIYFMLAVKLKAFVGIDCLFEKLHDGDKVNGACCKPSYNSRCSVILYNETVMCGGK